MSSYFLIFYLYHKLNFPCILFYVYYSILVQNYVFICKNHSMCHSKLSIEYQIWSCQRNFFTFSFLQKYHITLKFNFAFIAKSTYLSLYIFLFGKLISYSITISKVYILRWINSHSILYLVWCGYFISRQPNKFFCKDKICKWQHS